MDNNDEDEYLYGSEPASKKQKTEEVPGMFFWVWINFCKWLTVIIKKQMFRARRRQWSPRRKKANMMKNQNMRMILTMNQ